MEKKNDPRLNATALICEAIRKGTECIERLQEGELDRACNRLNDAALAWEAAAHALFEAQDEKKKRDIKKS